MATFGLVHGAFHGAWCWERLVPELEALGHRAVAADLPASDPTAACSRYADVVAEALADVEDDVVLVGHSLGGLTIPLVPSRRAVARLVYLTALVPEPGSPATALFAGDPPSAVDWRESLVDHGDGTSSWNPEAAAGFFYHDCDPADATWAVSQLRPQAGAPSLEPCPLDALPDLPTSYVLCGDDRVITAGWQRRAARRRLGVEPIEIDGGHSPFLARPRELALVLAGLTA